MLHTSNSCFLEGGQKYKDIFFRVRNLITAFFENATWCPISKLKEVENGIKSILRVYTQNRNTRQIIAKLQRNSFGNSKWL